MLRGVYPGIVGLLLASAAVAQEEDSTVVETGDPNMTPEKLEDQPEVDALPDWLIDIPPAPEREDSAAQMDTRPVEYVVEDKHVVSQSRMFSVSGGDILRMGAIATHADDMRKRFNRLLGMDDKWK